jgi:hypothetical protein
MKQVILILTLLGLSCGAWAQQGRPDASKIQERVEAKRAAFLSTRLKLTPEEAQIFFPLFNEYTAKVKTIREQAKPSKAVEDMNDAEAEKMVTAQMDVGMRLLDLKKDYYQKFKKVIGAKRVAMLFKAEREFKGELLNELQSRHDQKHPQRPMRDRQ